MKIECKSVRSGYDRQTCWVQTRAAYVPGLNKAVMTTQKLRLSGSDIFYAIHSMHRDSDDGAWSEPVEQQSFLRRDQGDGAYFYVSDFWPKWHRASGTILGTGHTPLYRNDELCSESYRRTPAYAVYNLETDTWNDWKFAELPDEPLFFNCGAGCTQRLDLANGDILLPVYCRNPVGYGSGQGITHSVVVIRFSYDGQTLTYREHGNFMFVDRVRGLCEPSLAMAGGRYFLTLRNDEKAYLAVSDDGLNFSDPVPWCFDDNREIGSYNTQQHWVTFGEQLFLVYTRKGLGNDHVFRHRAPLVIAELDQQNLCLIKESEQIVVPERGARLGNFGVTEVAENKAWVVVSEWMQGLQGTSGNPAELEKYGSENTIFIAELDC